MEDIKSKLQEVQDFIIKHEGYKITYYDVDWYKSMFKQINDMLDENGK